MLINGFNLNALLVSIAQGGILREYSAPPDNVGWFKADGDLIDYPSRRELNALVRTGMIRPEQASGKEGGQFTKYVLTGKGSRFAAMRENKLATIAESFWTIACDDTEVYFHVGTQPPDPSAIIPADLKPNKMDIQRHKLDAVSSDALLMTENQLAATQ